MKRFADEFPTVCGVCKREAGASASGNLGRGKPRLWRCDNPDCASLAHRVLKMPIRDLSTLEEWALSDAGVAAGQYLEGLGKTDLGDLSPHEWSRFLKTILTSYESQMRQRLTDRLGKGFA